MLDLCDLFGIPNLQEFISVRYFCTGEWSRTVNVAKDSIFGETEHVLQFDVTNLLTTLLQIEDPLSASKALRNIVLVGHGITSRRSLFASIELDIDTIAPVIGILDTPEIAEHIYGKCSYALKTLLETVSCP